MNGEKRITDEGMDCDKSQMEAGGLRVAIDHLRAALEALEGQIMPKPEAAMPEPETMEAEPETDDLLLTEAAPLEIAEAEAPTNRRAPLDMNVGLIRVGPGNARDRHYYTAEMLERDGGVFQGVKMYATDHRNDEKSVRTEVSQVREVAGLREIDGERYLVGRVTVFNPDFAEDVRNRADAGVLDSLHCSILARGEAQPAEVGGQEYNVVQRITEARSVDWVTRAGAGGRALELAESEPEPESPEPTEVEESSAQAVLISEDAAQEVIESLAVGEVLAELGTTNLPAASVSALALAEYHDLSEVRSAVATEVVRLKAAGSGQPLGTAKPPEPRPVSRADVQKLLAEVNQKWLGG